MAWDAFERKNGVESLDGLVDRVRKYRRTSESPDPTICCNVLAEPFFVPRSQWIPVPQNWARNIVQGRSYQSDTPDGRALVSSLETALATLRDATRSEPATDRFGRRYGSEYLTRGRLGQGAFRVLVTDAYNLESIPRPSSFDGTTSTDSMDNARRAEGNMSSELLELRDAIRLFAAEREWDQFHSPKNLASALAVEAAELLEHFQWLTEEQSRVLPESVKVSVADEMADVLIYLVRLADKLNIELIAAVRGKMARNALKYPVEKARGSAKKYTEL